jgi:hypothetical protein
VVVVRGTPRDALRQRAYCCLEGTASAGGAEPQGTSPGGGARIPRLGGKERSGHENITTTVDLYGKRVPSVDAALANAVGASIFTEQTNVVPLRKEDAS